MNDNIPLSKQGLSLLIGNLLGFFAQMATSVILVRLISKSDFGLYQQFILITGSLIPILRIGLDSSLFYFIPTLTKEKQNNIIVQTFIIKLFMGILFILLCLVYNTIDFSWINLEELNKYKISVSFFILFMLLSSLVEHIFTLDKNLIFNRYYQLVEKSLKFILLISFVLLFKLEYAILNALVVFSFFRFVFLIFYLRKRLFSNITFSYDLFSRQLLYAIPFAGSILLNLLSTRIDKFVINGYINIEEYAVYSIAFLSIPFIGQIFSSIHNVAMPEFSKLGKENNIKDAALLWKNIITKTSSVAIPAVIFFFLMSDILIEIIYTKSYISAAPYYRILIFSIFFSMLSYGLVLRGFNKTKFLFLSDLIGVCIIIPLSFILIKEFHVYGAAYTALIGMGLPIIIKIIFELRLLKIKFLNWMAWNKIGQILLISCLLSIFPIICVETIRNIYLCFMLASILYFPLIAFFEWKFNLFIYPDAFKKINKYFNNKLEE